VILDFRFWIEGKDISRKAIREPDEGAQTRKVKRGKTVKGKG
jgi:hypothetical protein